MDLRVPEDINQNLQQCHKNLEKRYNFRKGDVLLRIGDLALADSHFLPSKIYYFALLLAPKWLGSYRIVNFLTPVSLLLEDTESSQKTENTYK
ncbi:hypothetical protein PR048_005425 [Dryococelus australis]|uniref:Uncharacterized protein n=1 Tax=Dryococelus australis TaxID=614101 RepID=A0ABQ9I872_9NEOP|nr:hypothetical protein PR048_005425 [Dryococelus australis]